MARIRRSAEQIISKLREAEVLLGPEDETPEGYEAAWSHRANVLPIAQEVRRAQDRLSEEAQEARA